MACMQPLILVTADVKQMDGATWHAASQTYLSALANVAKVQPVIVPSLADSVDFETLLARADGLLVTGARSNVHPNLYKQKPSKAYEPYDDERDATTLPLIRAALDAGLPTLCVCRGIQELNVAYGGTLATEIQEHEGRMDHRATESDDNDVRYQIDHAITPVAGGVLAGIIGDLPVRVNSLHRQAISRLGEGLKIEASAEDGTIEAVSVIDAPGFNLAVQWHPEYWVQSDQVSRQIFEHFGRVTRQEK
ncbi:MAG: gamma-glutamyl-gamma-aminobutyrate hydrolase [Hyphomicrobiales bacterium]|nr:MAG: gamma-glutamyl-gamma-aminobutyrate hydrolase [Hyphomicrobiales bacterium]